MSKQTEALKLALEALEGLADYRYTERVKQALAAIREALAEQPKVWVTPKLRPLAKLAKELDGVVADVEQGDGFDDVCLDTVKYVRDELTEQPAQQQEPVAIALNTGTKQGVKWLKNVEHGERLYTSPPASKPWVGLTDKEAEDVWNRYCDEMGEASINDALDIASAIEAKLREKNV